MPDRNDLRADCERCFALCCVAPAFAVSADFPIHKPAGVACHHLDGDFRCGIHSGLRNEGFVGCTVFDCFGAGQQVSQVSFAGRDWRQNPALAAPMFDVFAVMRQLHELRWYLADALDRAETWVLHADLRRAAEGIAALVIRPAQELADLDVEAERAAVRPLLRRVSDLVRRHARPDGADLAGADLVGQDLRTVDLRAACLRGGLLLGADLRGVDLRAADVLGADLRGADLRGADLRGALFATAFQIAGARGDERTRLPDAVPLPRHWRPAARGVSSS